MTDRLDGTAALITGASSGIGEAIAVALAGQGAAVAIAARRTDRLTELARRIRDSGGGVAMFPAYVTDRADALGLADKVVDEFGRLDTVVNNAGMMLLGPAVGAPVQEWEQMVALNLQGLLWVTHGALPHLLTAADSSPREVADLVNISSVAGRTARSGSGVYNATKWGVGAFSESLRQELAGRRVRVSLIEPGAVDTELRTHLRPEVAAAQQARFDSVTPLLASDIAEAATLIVTRRADVAINEILIRPTAQV